MSARACLRTNSNPGHRLTQWIVIGSQSSGLAPAEQNENTKGAMKGTAIAGTKPEFGLPTANALRDVLVRIARILGALAIIAAFTYFFSRLVPVNATAAGLFYLVVILLIAAAQGLIESTVASIAAVFCFNMFFLPPIGKFTINNPHNWIALFAFLLTSLTASQLSARAKQRTQEALARRNELQKLYSLSQALLLSDVAQPIEKEIVKYISQAFGFSSVALYARARDCTYKAGFDDSAGIDALLRGVALDSAALHATGPCAIHPVQLRSEIVGALAVQDAGLSEAALNSILNLVAAAIERAQSQNALNRAEVSRQGDELKSTLLDAIAHEFKTPLTSIKAATSELLSSPIQSLSRDHQELVTIVDSSTDRLSKLVSNAIQLARIEGGTFRLHEGDYFPGLLIARALRQVDPLADGRAIQVLPCDDLPPVRVDADLIEIAITQLLDNALKYTPPNSSILVHAQLKGSKVIIAVKDHGPGISEEEQSSIFEKFQRGSSPGNLRGSGMGLSIAREIMRAHSEDINLTSRLGEGAEFRFTLPLATGSSTR